MGLGNSAGNGRDNGGLLGARPAEVVFDEASHWADGDRAYARSDIEIERDAVVRWIGRLQHTKASIEPVLGYLEPLTIGDVMGQPHPGEAPFMRPAQDAESKSGKVRVNFTVDYSDVERSVKHLNAVGQRLFVAQHAGVPPIKLGPVGSEYERKETPSVFERVVLGNTAMYIAFGVLCAAFVFCIMMLAGAGKASGGDPYSRVLPAIAAHESQDWTDFYGDWVDDNGDKIEQPEECRAHGPLQIREIMVRECNRIAEIKKLDVRFTSADRMSTEKSFEMFRLYSDFWSKDQSEEVIARRWNGGPKGEKKSSTAQYWAKVKAKMNGGAK